MRDIRSYLLVAATAAIVAYLATPVIRYVAIKLDAVDRPGGRKVHAIPTPTLGGVAMFFGFLAGLALASRLPAFQPLFIATSLPGYGPLVLVSEVLGMAIGAALMVVIGMVDDTMGLTAPAKLAAQIFVASVMTLTGVRVFYFWVPGLDTLSLPPDLSMIVTVLLVIVTVNAVNLVDGLDGLAAGLVGIGALAFFIYSYRMGSTGVISDSSAAPLISALLFGICAGFLPHNFNPARIFMGDTGSMLLGTLLAGATVTGIGRSGQPQAGDQFAILIPVAIPILVLALPFLDTFLAVGRRMRTGQGVMTADKNHLHHRLLEIGHSHRKAVLVLYVWGALLAFSAVALSFTGPTRVLPYFLVVLGCGVIALLGPRRRERQRG